MNVHKSANNAWNDDKHYLRGTATDTLTLPQTIYGDGTNATLTLKGNTGGVGDLVTEGEHAGEYAIPITNNGITTNVYNATALDISDTLTTTISTTDGANALSVDTTIQPSEVTLNYHGWHSIQSAHEKSKNLWDEDYAGISSTVIYLPIYVGNGDYTMSTNCPLYNQTSASLFLLAGNVSTGISTSTNGVYEQMSRTVTSVDGYVTIAYRIQGDISPVNYNTMLNIGGTALPYEPYWN